MRTLLRRWIRYRARPRRVREPEPARPVVRPVARKVYADEVE